MEAVEAVFRVVDTLRWGLWEVSSGKDRLEGWCESEGRSSVRATLFSVGWGKAGLLVWQEDLRQEISVDVTSLGQNSELTFGKSWSSRSASGWGAAKCMSCQKPHPELSP